MPLVDWKVDENIAVLTMNYGENRFNLKFCSEMMAALNDIEQKTEVNALVVTASDAKIWSNGMDLEWLVPAIAKKDPEAEQFFILQDQLMRRVLFYPMITVAALSGHAFASGAIFSCCFDFRFMRSDRGFLCFPEVDINIPFLPYMTGLVKKAFPLYLAHEAVLTGKRFTATELEKANVIRKACSMDELMKESTTFARGLNKGRAIITHMKKVLYEELGVLMDHANDHRPQLDTGTVPIK
ncbi:MAG: enoyl-CoA hydratase/isomerase family protein [Dehalococcoidia bacterium]|nr:enoyl-CoA hydratase/isomerase family protein [Dehalococcoidia bacterium]